jgi:hypothetical protein
VYNRYDTEQELINTLPMNAIKILNQFLESNDVILPLALPEKYNNTSYSFDARSAVFHGPYRGFRDGVEYLQVEQQQDDNSKFYIFWIASDPNTLSINFFRSKEEK